jgi:hypothetical protein
LKKKKNKSNNDFFKKSKEYRANLSKEEKDRLIHQKMLNQWAADWAAPTGIKMFAIPAGR